MALSPQWLDQLRTRVTLSSVIMRTTKLQRAGREWKACCPFHDEKTPSFTVNDQKGFYHCFGCGAHGDVIRWMTDQRGLTFMDAVKELAVTAGMEMPAPDPREAQKAKRRAGLHDAMGAAQEFFVRELAGPRGNPARDYLDKRGFSPATMREFGFGYAPDERQALATALGTLPPQLLVEGGLRIAIDGKDPYDRFRDRLMLPIHDVRGRVIAFGGRILTAKDGAPKYLNSPETPVFHKGQELYGLYEARQANRDLDEIMVVEGYMDVIALAQQGLRNAVATLGTATSEEHLKRLFRIVPSVLFCFDGDAAGRNAAWRALESTLSSLQDGRRARFLFLPDGEDPDTLVRAEGTDAFRARINQHAQPLADYFFQQLSEEADPRSLEGKAHLVTLAAPLIDKIPGNNLRALMRQRLSEITGLSGEALSQVASSPRSPAPSPASPAPGSDYPDYGDIPDSAYYDSLPDVGGYEQPAPPQQQYYERSNEGGKGNWKKDGGKWNKKGKGDFAPRAPRTAVSVESPHLIALRTLLHHPQLAQKVEDVSHFADEDDTYAQLLVALVGALQKTPNLRSLQLIARWHGTEQGRLLRALAEKEWLIKGDNLEQQFFDTITTLAHNQSQRRREKALRSIMQKSPSELTDEEKTLLREHYSLTSSQSSKSPTGA